MDLIIAACRALAYQPRLRLLRAIQEQPGITVSNLAAQTGLPMAAVSVHLKLLSSLQLIQRMPSGRHVKCSVAPRGSTKNGFLCGLQALMADWLASGSLNRTLSKVCDCAPQGALRWDTIFDAIRKLVTTFTHLRRLLILRWLATHGAGSPEQLRSGIGMSADAARRQLDKLQRRGIIVRLPSRPGAWTLASAVQPPGRRQLLALVLRAMKIH
jgi:DNA-binding MarR family transcriptional regulator